MESSISQSFYCMLLVHKMTAVFSDNSIYPCFSALSHNLQQITINASHCKGDFSLQLRWIGNNKSNTFYLSQLFRMKSREDSNLGSEVAKERSLSFQFTNQVVSHSASGALPNFNVAVLHPAEYWILRVRWVTSMESNWSICAYNLSR